MCLCKDDKKTEEFRKKHAGKTITVWKVYEVKQGLVFCQFKSILPLSADARVKSGSIISDRESVEDDDKDCLNSDEIVEVNRGIHVYLSRKEARKGRQMMISDDRVFRCTAKVDDLVGLDSDTKTAVFMKIHISQKEFGRGKKGRN